MSEGTPPRVAPLRQLKEACASLRTTLKALEVAHAAGQIDKAQLKQQRWDAVVVLSAMKAGLRDTFLAGDAWKTRVQAQKDTVETHQLQLQNLLYEKDHLVREIRRCKGFHTSEMDRITFATDALPIAVDPSIHRQHLDQLTHELETRKRMVTQVKEVKAKIEVVEAATQRKQGFLDGLRNQLDHIEDATSGLQTHMRTPVSTTLRLQHDASTQLAPPLYTLFGELQAYQTASNCTQQLQVAIVDAKGGTLGSGVRVAKRAFPSALLAGGRVGRGGPNAVDAIEPPASKRLKGPSRSPSVATQRERERGASASKAPSRSPSMSRTRPVERGEAEEDGAVRETPTLMIKAMRDVQISPDEENDGVVEDEAADPTDLWQCATKAVLLTLSLAIDDASEGTETLEFGVLFQYFPIADVVTAELVTPTTLGKHVLTNLFPGDDGQQMGNLATAYKYRSANGTAEIAFPTEATASRPYLWTQWICGLHPLQRSSSSASESQRRPEPSVRNVLQQLIKRLTGATQLRRHLAALTKGQSQAPIHPSFASHFPSVIQTKMVGWKHVPHPRAEMLDRFQGAPKTGNQYFTVAFQHATLHIDAIVEVSPEYPVRAPQFRLRPGATGNSTSTVDNALQDIELEVNTYYDELVTPSCEQYLLAHQLRKVQHCVDVLSADTTGNLPTCFGRARRGKDRRPALVVDPVTKEVRHR